MSAAPGLPPLANFEPLALDVVFHISENECHSFPLVSPCDEASVRLSCNVAWTKIVWCHDSESESSMLLGH